MSDFSFIRTPGTRLRGGTAGRVQIPVPVLAHQANAHISGGTTSRSRFALNVTVHTRKPQRADTRRGFRVLRAVSSEPETTE